MLSLSASSISAFAEKKTICQWRLSVAYIGDFETGPLGIGVKICRVIDAPPTRKFPSNSGAGYGKPIQEQKLKNRL